MQKKKPLKGFGYILTGLGFLFLGIHHMKEGFEAFKSAFDLSSYAVNGLKGMMIFLGIGMLATIIMQSSHATMVLNITALSVGQITYENAVSLSIGAAIGTTITAVIGSLSSNIEGKRLAAAHCLFNVINGVLAIFIIDYILIAVGEISTFLGIAQDDYPLRLAVFDTFFKVSGVMLFLPLMNKLVTFLYYIFKDKAQNIHLETINFLNDSVLELPSTSLTAIVNETKHLYDIAFKIIANGMILKQRNILSNMDLESVISNEYIEEEVDVNREYITRVKEISGVILDFSTRAQISMDPENIQKIFDVKLANRSILLAIKATQYLCQNMKIYTKSKNEYIKGEYNQIRKNLIELLRAIHAISKADNEIDKKILLEEAMIHAEKNDVFANGSLDNLIRQELISNKMATSLMNDGAYAYDISQNLIATAEILFMNKQDGLQDNLEY